MLRHMQIPLKATFNTSIDVVTRFVSPTHMLYSFEFYCKQTSKFTRRSIQEKLNSCQCWAPIRGKNNSSYSSIQKAWNRHPNSKFEIPNMYLEFQIQYSEFQIPYSEFQIWICIAYFKLWIWMAVPGFRTSTIPWGEVVANISRCANHLKLWLHQLNLLMSITGQWPQFCYDLLQIDHVGLLY